MKRFVHISGAVLPTVMVVSALLALSTLALVSLWEADIMFFSKCRHDAQQRADISSGFTLYAEYPDQLLSRLDADSTIMLYDSMVRSRIKIRRKQWGLYEVVTIESYDGAAHSSKILGKRTLCQDRYVLYCRDNNSAVTVSGKTHFKGSVKMPRNGVVYGQMGSVFFSGEKAAAGTITPSEKDLPEPDPKALAAIKELKNTASRGGEHPHTDSLAVSFSALEPLIIGAGERLDGIILSGNIIIVAEGEELTVSRSCRLSDVIVVGRKVCIEDGFKGSLQVFASDSLVLGKNITLDFPSGLFSEKHVGIDDDSTVNGYAIVKPSGKPDIKHANYEQSRLAVVRGLVYIAGTAQLQGIVSGVAILDKAVYYSPRGYYENMICDATFLQNHGQAWALWLDGPKERKEAKWVN